MPTDVLMLNALARELDTTLKGARIDKIYQPESDEVTFLLRADNQNKLLVISANPSIPRLHISSQKKDNPTVAPGFCMLLRKHLTSARIKSVSLYSNDRIIDFCLSSKNEMMDEVELHLYFEYMGRYSNLVLTNENGKILDVIRKVSLDSTRSRKLLPGFTYYPPTQDKINIFDKANLSRLVEFSNGDVDILLKSCSGLARESATELVKRAKSYPNFSDGFMVELEKMFNSPTPIVGYSDGQAKDFFIAEYHTLPLEYEKSSTLSQAMEECYSSKDRISRIKSKSKHFHTVVKNAISRCEKKLGVNRQKLLDCDKAELDKLKGELINAYIYKIEKGMTSVTVTNYYDGSEITITLDGTTTPAQNAQNYFRRYTKLKRTKETLEKMVVENEENLHYLKSLLYDIENLTIESDVLDIQQALINYGLIDKKPTKVKQVQKPSTPYVFNCEGIEIHVGRNNVQNDALTFRTSQKSDTWLHVKDYHGSHVIVKAQNIPDGVLKIASELASYYSEAKDSDKVQVDYTLVKNVKRHPSKQIGLVIYDDYTQILAKPNPHDELRVK